MASITELRPDEITRILEQQLAGTLTSKELEDTGVVLQVGDGIARIYGLTEVQAGELIEFESGERGIVLNLEEDNVGAVVMGRTENIHEGDRVKRLYRVASIQVSEKMLGRVINPFGAAPGWERPYRRSLL